MSQRIVRTSARLCAALIAASLAGCGGGGGGGSESPGTPAAAYPDGDHILFALTGLSITEFEGNGSISVVRTGDATGDTSISYRINDGSAENGTDFMATDGVLSWAAGDSSARQISFDVYPDIETEALENFDVELFGLAGAETLSGSSTITVELADSACQSVSGEFSGNTSWAAPCYHLIDTVTMSGQAQLTIEQGATVIANANAGITVKDTATIYVNGTQSHPVRLKGASSSAGSWSGIAVTSTNPMQQMNHAIIEGANIGVDLVQGAQLGSFSNNSISNTEIAAIRIPTDVIDSLGDGLVFENNPGGIQLLKATIDSTNPLTLTPQATHYSTGDSMIVDGSLVLKPGVDLRFGADTLMYVSQIGSVNAVGTEANPIVITGINPSAGFWNGIQWVASSSANNRLSHVILEYGGGDPARPGNVIVAGSGGNLVIDNTTIANSRGYGIYQSGSGSTITQQLNVSYSNNELGDHFIQ